MFHGREEELVFLESKFKNQKGQLIVLYGRRRIGKTELLRQFCKDKLHAFYVCRECTDSEQRELYSRKLLELSGEKSHAITFRDWEAAFSYIKNMPVDAKKLVVIDEFPYMVYNNPSIPSILQNLWDEVLKNENVMIILCGSSMGFIEKEILGEKSPLFGRATGIYKLSELDYFTSSAFFNQMNTEDKITAYSILGGVPHYLLQFDDGISLEKNIKDNILRKGSVLYNEVEFLMKQELRETAIYYSIVEAVAMGNTKLNDIYLKTQIDKTKIQVYLKNLIKLNIIEREYPVTSSIKKTANSQNGFYKLKDNYFRFYFRFVFPNLSELETGDIDGVYEYQVKPHINEFVSFAFEEICIQYMRKLNKTGRLPFRFSKIGRWWDKKNEIDIAAFDDNGNVLLGECKWRNTKILIKDLDLLKHKSRYLDLECKSIFYYLFSKSGFDDSLKQFAEHDDSIKLVDLSSIA